MRGQTVSEGTNGVRYPFRGYELRRVFFNPNSATAFDTQGSEPYGLLRLMAYRMFSISSFGWGWFSH